MNIIHGVLKKNFDESYDIIIYLGGTNFKFSKKLLPLNRKNLKNISIRMIKIILEDTIAVSAPISQVSAKDGRYATSYVYFGSEPEQIEYITLAENTLNAVSPSYFDILKDGSLNINYIGKNFVDTMHEKGLKVVPFLSNHWDRTAGQLALGNIDELSNQIVDAIEENNLDGVNIDIENVTENEKDEYTQLVKTLREKLPKDKELSVAVAANPNGLTSGWQGSYDYEKLGEIADYLFLMAYDEHYQGSDPGPVASLPFVEDSIKYALQYVDSGKIVLGIPFFGRIWSSDGSVKGIGLSNKKIEEILKKYNGVTTYDPIARSPKATVNITDEVDIGNNITLKEGIYEIWYENSDSIKEKLALVDKYNLKGAGNWSTGQETKDVWDYYDLWLNGKYFEDIYNSFAKDNIQRVVKDGYMIGTSSTKFSPEKSLTRGEAAAVIARVLSLDLANGENYFDDISNHFAKNEINAVSKAGLIKGYPDGSFRPNDSISREEMASILSKVIEYDYKGDKTINFTDVSPDRWSYNEIASLASMGILKGYEDGSFRPENPLLRAEMAALIDRITSE